VLVSRVSSKLPYHPADIAELIVPLACKPDIDENVPASVKEGIEFVFVEEVRQVLHEVFKGTDAVTRWKETLPMEDGEGIRG
jgi:Lon-like ATP-dependent protease